MVALIPAAGRGARFGATENKVFVPVLGRPMLAWTLEAFAQCDAITGVVLVGAEDDLPRLRTLGEQYVGAKLRAVLPGGATRQESVHNGLSVCADFDYVAVHDAARPCITPEIIEATVQSAVATGAATVAFPVSDTLVRANSNDQMGTSVDRDGLWAIQTPQVFRTDLLTAAHEEVRNQTNADAPPITDDARLMDRLGIAVALVRGTSENLKVTRPEDLALAESILARRNPSMNTAPPPRFRVGHGYDVHPFADGRPLFLGGVEFPDAPRGLLGHSDADVILHALCDALLGAAGMGDIGKLFPPSDMRHKDRRSTEFLEEVRERIDPAGWQICNIDITVLAETPKIGPKSDEIKATIAVILGIMPEQIGLKATTNEGLGFIGRSEGIAVHATALLVARDS